MTSILDDLADDVTAALAGRLRSVTYLQGDDTGTDQYGNPVTVWTAFQCEGVRGSYSDEYAAILPRTASKVELLAGTLGVMPANLDRIQIDGEWFIVVNVGRDPAGAWHVLECAASSDPRT